MLQDIYNRYNLNTNLIAAALTLALVVQSVVIVSFVGFIRRSSLRLDMFGLADLAIYSFSFYANLAYCIAFIAFAQFVFHIAMVVTITDASENSEEHNAIETWAHKIWPVVSSPFVPRLFPLISGVLFFLFSFGKFSIEHMGLALLAIIFAAAIIPFARREKISRKPYGALIAGLIYTLAILSGELRAVRNMGSDRIAVTTLTESFCGNLLFYGSQNIALREKDVNLLIRTDSVTRILLPELC